MIEQNQAASKPIPSASPEPWTIILLTCRNEETDFRLPMAEELASLGHDVSYIFLKRRPKITNKQDDISSTVSFVEMLRFLIKKRKSGRKLLVFNSTNLAFPMTSIALKALVGGSWCLDIHDDLLYNSTGISRFASSLKLRMLLAGSDLTVHSAHALAELFPQSRHLGNASNILPISREISNPSKLLILASMDERFDFEFVDRLARDLPDTQIDIHGSVSQDRKSTFAKMDELLHDRPNVIYKGRYKNSQLSAILKDYAVTIAPYMTDRTTRYIDPLRYYHCLNSGMEVISTKVPQADYLSEALHLVDSPDQAKAIIVGLASNAVKRRNLGAFHIENNWKTRANKLIDIVKTAAKQ